MTAKITSIVGARSRAKRRDAEALVTRRVITLLVVPMTVLLVVGLGAILSASSVPTLADFDDSLYYFRRFSCSESCGVEADRGWRSVL